MEKDLKDSLKGVPLLVIYDKQKNAKYVGGYSDKVITPLTKINIDPFLNNIRNKREVSSLPVKGCAVSKEYQKILDPFGIKYTEI